MQKNDYLKSAHTRQLIRWRDEAYAGGGIYTPFDYNTNSAMTFRLDEIVNELNTREHVPNKKEARALRQQRAKTKQ